MLKDRVKVSTNTTGTGVITLGDIQPGFQGFDSIGNSDTYYAIINGGQWEVGHGTHLDGLLYRNSVLDSSNSGSLINLVGKSYVFVTYPADKAVFTSVDSIPSSGDLLFKTDFGWDTRPLSSGDVISALGTSPFYTANSGVTVSGNNFSMSGIGRLEGLLFDTNIIVGDKIPNNTKDKNIIVGWNCGTSGAIYGVDTTANVYIGNRCGTNDFSSFLYTVEPRLQNSFNVAIGSGNLYNSSIDSARNVAIGHDVLNYMTPTSGVYKNVVALGYGANASTKSVESSVSIGTSAGANSPYLKQAINIGPNAGYNASGELNVYIGNAAGFSNSGNKNIEIATNDQYPYTLLRGSDTGKINIGHVIAGDSIFKKLAIGNVTSSNLDPSAVLEIIPRLSTDRGLLIRRNGSYTANFIEAQTSASVPLFIVTRTGLVSGLSSTFSNGIYFQDAFPAVTDRFLYSTGTSLFWSNQPILTGAFPTYTANSGISVSGNNFQMFGTGKLDSLVFDSNVKIGSGVFQNTSLDSTMNVAIGYEALKHGTSNSGIYKRSVALGQGAGQGSEEAYDSTFLGTMAGAYSIYSADSLAMGSYAGYNSSGIKNLYLGFYAGQYNSGNRNIEIITSDVYPYSLLSGTDSDKLNIGHSIVGDLASKKIAVGNVSAGAISPNATFEILPKAATDKGLFIKARPLHSANILEIQDSSANSLFSVTPSGLVSGVSASFNSGITISSGVPSSTANTLYASGSSLVWRSQLIASTLSVTGLSGQSLSVNQSGTVTISPVSGARSIVINSAGGTNTPANPILGIKSNTNGGSGTTVFSIYEETTGGDNGYITFDFGPSAFDVIGNSRDTKLVLRSENTGSGFTITQGVGGGSRTDIIAAGNVFLSLPNILLNTPTTISTRNNSHIIFFENDTNSIQVRGQVATGDTYFALNSNSVAASSGHVYIQPKFDKRGLVIRASGNNTANLFEVQNSLGSHMLAIDPLGRISQNLAGSGTNRNITSFGPNSLNAANAANVTSLGNNTAIGAYSLYNATGGISNTCVGVNTGRNITVGGQNTIVGKDAGFSMSTSQYSAIFGERAGYFANTTVTAIGCLALYNVTTGQNNLGVGFQAGQNITVGVENTVLGTQAMFTSSTGNMSYNVAVGTFALYSNSANSNTSVGWRSLRNVTGIAANANVGLGADAGLSLLDGFNNIFLGTRSDVAAGSGQINGAIVLGYEAKANQNYQFALGSTTSKIGKSDGTGEESTSGSSPSGISKLLEARINGTSYKIPLLPASATDLRVFNSLNVSSGVELNNTNLSNPVLKSYGETVSSSLISGGVLSLDLSQSNNFSVGLSENVTGVIISNPKSSGIVQSFSLFLNYSASAYSITWPSNIYWNGGSSAAPVLSSGVGRSAILSFTTINGGSTYLGSVGGTNFGA